MGGVSLSDCEVEVETTCGRSLNESVVEAVELRLSESWVEVEPNLR